MSKSSIGTKERVNAAFREIAPAVFEAWLIEAADRPDEQYIVCAQIPKEMLLNPDRAALERAVTELFMVASAEVKENLADTFQVPGIMVMCQPWNTFQRVAATIRAERSA